VRPRVIALACMTLFACKKERVERQLSATEKCNALFDGAQRDFADALPRERPCKEVSDCQVVYTDMCNPSMCGEAAVPKTAVPALAETRRQIDQTKCRQYSDADCARITPRPVASCPHATLLCADGGCALEPWHPPR
jgi:hypothetical protein